MKILLTILLVEISALSFGQQAPIPFRKGDTWGYSNVNGTLIIAAKYQDAGQFFHGLAWVKEKGHYHYIDVHGKKRFNKSFFEAGDFEPGYAFVRRRENDTLEVLKPTGEIYVPGMMQGNDVHMLDFFGYPDQWMIGRSGKEFYYMNQQGDTLRYDADAFRSFKTSDYGRRMTVEHALISKAGKYGVLHESGRFVLPVEHDSILIIEDLMFRVMKDSKWAYFDRTGKQITAFRFDELGRFWITEKYFDKLQRRDYSTAVIDGKVGFINASGEVFIPCKYQKVTSFKDDLAKVTLNGKSGYVSKVGKEYFED